MHTNITASACAGTCVCVVFSVCLFACVLNCNLVTIRRIAASALRRRSRARPAYADRTSTIKCTTNTKGGPMYARLISGPGTAEISPKHRATHHTQPPYTFVTNTRLSIPLKVHRTVLLIYSVLCERGKRRLQLRLLIFIRIANCDGDLVNTVVHI